VAFFTLVNLLACESNPPLGLDGDELSVELAVAASGADPSPVDHAHVHTLSEVTFHVQVRDHHGHHVTDFEAIGVEHRRHGTDDWRTAADLHLHGETFRGSYEYTASGEYDLRVSGLRHGHGGGHMSTLHHEHHPLQVARAHRTIGNYRIEFETFPGHIHAGDDVAVRFWVMEAEPDAEGVRPAVSGLAATIRLEEADGSVETHSAVEADAGVYEVSHLFEAASRARALIRFTTPEGDEVEAEFEPHVAAAH
jgi:hypothetical protein